MLWTLDWGCSTGNNWVYGSSRFLPAISGCMIVRCVHGEDYRCAECVVFSTRLMIGFPRFEVWINLKWAEIPNRGSRSGADCRSLPLSFEQKYWYNICPPICGPDLKDEKFPFETCEISPGCISEGPCAMKIEDSNPFSNSSFEFAEWIEIVYWVISLPTRVASLEVVNCCRLCSTADYAHLVSWATNKSGLLCRTDKVPKSYMKMSLLRSAEIELFFPVCPVF